MSVKSSFENVTMVFMGGYLPNWIPAQKAREKVDSAPKDEAIPSPRIHSCLVSLTTSRRLPLLGFEDQ